MLLAALQSRSPVALRTASKSAGRVLKEGSPEPASRLTRSPLTSSQQLQLQHPYRGGNRGSITAAVTKGSTATMPDFRSIKQVLSAYPCRVARHTVVDWSSACTNSEGLKDYLALHLSW